MRKQRNLLAHFHYYTYPSKSCQGFFLNFQGFPMFLIKNINLQSLLRFNEISYIFVKTLDFEFQG